VSADRKLGRTAANTSAFKSLIQGLLLKVPEFQLSANGIWTSAGLALSLLLMAICAGLFIEEGPIKYWLRDNQRLQGAIFTSLIAVVFLLAWTGFHKIAKSRQLVASWIAAIAAALTTLWLVGVAPMLWLTLEERFEFLPRNWVPLTWSAFVFALAYAAIKIRSYR
jgi:hypothetical protein